MTTPVDILLVDDEARNLDALEAILENPRYRLLRAEDADAALRLLLSHDVAAIVLDIKMPGVSGFELARMIKNTKRFRETPIVFLTAYLLDDENVIAGYGAGGVDYLTKPVNPQILRQKVGVFADLHRKTRQLAQLNAELGRLNEKLEERVKERTEELERSEAALLAAAKQKDEFLAVLAHELRNPLAPLRTGLELLTLHHGATPAPAVIRTIGAMNRQLDHMVRLIDDLLDISRLSRGILQLRRERVDLSNVVQSTAEAVREWFERREQSLSVEAPESVFAEADPTRVSQILTNLLHNAMKFTDKGGAIRVKLEERAGKAELSVSDSGAGVPPELADRVFDMFARIERQGATAQPGLGIGLALARRLAEMHDGTLSLSSEGEGRGATFTLALPTCEAPERVARRSAAPPASGKAAGPLEIVVVEDNEDVADVLVDWLEELGHRVNVARTGQQGLDAIVAHRPQLVVCDLGLPELDGLDICRRVRGLGSEHQPTMVALTGWGREDDLRRSKEAGFDHHLVKPVTPAALHAVLASVSASVSERTG